METILIELPDSAISFKSKQDLDDYFRNEREFLYDTPDKYPCIGWHVGYMYNINGPDEVVWAFVYPAKQETIV